VPYPTGRTITYSYNAAAQPLSAIDATNGMNYALSASYTPHGALGSVLHGQSGGFGGITLTQGFDKRLQPVTLYASSSNGVVLDFAYCFNASVTDFAQNCTAGPVVNNGNVVRIKNNRNTDRSQRFTYDELNRIATARTQATVQPHCWGETFGYDVWGNLLSIGGIQPTYNGCTQENLGVTATTKNQISGYTYDAAGNMTTNPGVGTYTYDAENRMTVTAGVTYTYDGDGKRVKKSSGKLYWYGMGSDALLETDASGTVTDEYVFFNGRRVARRKSPSGEVNYYFGDQLGSSRVVTNGTGTILDDSDYYPFGGERSVLSSSGNNYKFTGKERDAESGLDYFGARYMSSGLGRFLAVDPSGASIFKPNPQTWNRYSYVLNQPLALRDPNGKWSSWDHSRIIDLAFRGRLDPLSIEILKQASMDVDKDQTAAGAHMHGMGSLGAENTFWNENLAHAVGFQMMWESQGRRGDSPNAIYFFGLALHTITDGTSPMHWFSSFTPWMGLGDPMRNLAALGHGMAESSIGAYERIKAESFYAARVEASWLWGKYQRMLEEARKKKEEEERKKREEECKKDPQACVGKEDSKEDKPKK
jgi:RHS repeat-associated protein